MRLWQRGDRPTVPAALRTVRRLTQMTTSPKHVCVRHADLSSKLNASRWQVKSQDLLRLSEENEQNGKVRK